MVLAGALTGDHRRDHAVDQILKTCQIHDVDEHLSRNAAALRTSTGRAAEISAVDAVVVTSDPRDSSALAARTPAPVEVVRA